MKVPQSPRSQQGAALLVGLVMLLIMLVTAIGLIRLSTRHTHVVNNEQLRTEAVLAANYALDTAINHGAVTGNWQANYSGAGVDVNVNLGTMQSADGGAGTIPVLVDKLTVKRCRNIQNRELFNSDGSINPQSATCIRANSNSSLAIGASNGGDPSQCSDTLYEMQAQVDSSQAPQMLSASVPVVQGVEVLAGLNCP